MILLSILIPTTPDRNEFVKRLDNQFISQLGVPLDLSASHAGGCAVMKSEFNEVEILYCTDDKLYSIGWKRNLLLQSATGKYIAFVDDDDILSDDYFKLVMEGIRKDVDCCSLKGIIYERNSPARHFEHSLRYDKYETVEPDPDGFSDRKYLRFTNHLNCIRRSIAKQFKFPGENHGEDTMWATALHESGLLKTEHYITEPIYFYTPSDTRK